MESRYYVAYFAPSEKEMLTFSDIKGTYIEHYRRRARVFNGLPELFNNLAKEQAVSAVIYTYNLHQHAALIISSLFKMGFAERPGKRELIAKQFCTKQTIDSQVFEITICGTVSGCDVRFIEFSRRIPATLPELAKTFASEFKDEIMTEQATFSAKQAVLVLKKASEQAARLGLHSKSLSAWAFLRMKKSVEKSILRSSRFEDDFKTLFPTAVEEMRLPGNETVADFLRPAYKGGLCILNAQRGEVGPFEAYDSNSEYPFELLTHPMPCGMPVYGTGEPPLNLAQNPNRCLFVRFYAEFEVKENHVPFLTVRFSKLYNPRENLATSRINGKRFITVDGQPFPARPLITMMRQEFELFEKTYQTEIKFKDWLAFDTVSGLFDEYFLGLYEKKRSATNPVDRLFYKLELNAPIGKFGQKREVANVNHATGAVTKERVQTSGYLPIAVAVTTYARVRFIKLANENHEKFIYADTDSLFLRPGAKIDCGDGLGEFKLEKKAINGCFFGKKQYFLKNEDGSYSGAYAGMSKRAQKNVCDSLRGVVSLREYELTAAEKEFINANLTFADLEKGATVPGNVRYTTSTNGVIRSVENFKILGKEKNAKNC